MIEHGVDIKSQLRFGASKIDSAMAQLLQYNCYSRYKEGASTYRHSKEREPPFGMSVYAKTRKKVLVELLHDHELSVSYERVLEISAQLGTSISLFQYPTSDNKDDKLEPIQIRDHSVKKTIPELPYSYTNVRPAAFPSKILHPQGQTQLQPLTYRNFS